MSRGRYLIEVFRGRARCHAVLRGFWRPPPRLRAARAVGLARSVALGQAPRPPCAAARASLPLTGIFSKNGYSGLTENEVVSATPGLKADAVA